MYLFQLFKYSQRGIFWTSKFKKQARIDLIALSAKSRICEEDFTSLDILFE